MNERGIMYSRLEEGFDKDFMYNGFICLIALPMPNRTLHLVYQRHAWLCTFHKLMMMT